MVGAEADPDLEDPKPCGATEAGELGNVGLKPITLAALGFVALALDARQQELLAA